jgi:hypothetical protein
MSEHRVLRLRAAGLHTFSELSSCTADTKDGRGKVSLLSLCDFWFLSTPLLVKISPGSVDFGVYPRPVGPESTGQGIDGGVQGARRL